MKSIRVAMGVKCALMAVVAACGASAWADNIVRLTHGMQVSEYATIEQALSSASDGDTLTLLGNVSQDSASLGIGKSVTFDLGGYEIANRGENSFNMIFINNGAQVTFKNGTLHSRWQSVLVPNSENSSITLTDCVLSGGTVTYSGFSGVTVTIGKGCVVTCGTLLYGMDGNTVIVEDGEIYSSTLRAVSGTLLVRGGKFATNPTSFLDDKRTVVAETQTTSYGTTYYRVDVSESNAATLVKAGTGEETEYSTVPMAINAASAGDTVRLLKDWVDPGTPYAITRQITLDLNNHAVSNSTSANLLSVNAPSVVIKNGTLSTPGQSSIVFDGANQAFLTNCVVGGATLSYSASRAELHVGKGCRLNCTSLVSGYFVGKESFGSCRVSVFIDDDDVICTSPNFFDNWQLPLSHLYVRGGKFAVNPASCVVGDRKAIQQETVTEYGTCNYTIVDRTGEETVTAETVFPNGETVKTETLAQAVEYARLCDTVRFLADQVVTGSASLEKCITYDLNGFTYEMTASGNFLLGKVDGIVFLNGTIKNEDNSLFCPFAENITMYATNCVLKGICGVYSGFEGSKVVLSGCTAELRSLFSQHSTCKVAVEVDGGYYSLDNNWGDNGGTGPSTLSIVRCRSTKDPSAYLAEGSYAAPIASEKGGKSYGYTSFTSDEAELYDLSSFVAIGGKMYSATVSDAYNYTPDCGELILLKDAEYAGSFAIRKSITLNLNGWTLSQTGEASNFLMLYDGCDLTVTGKGNGGTIAKLSPSNSAFWVDGNGGEVVIEDCKVTGATLAYGSSGRVVINSANASIENTSLVSSHYTCKLTVVVEAGNISTVNIWDSGIPSEGNGGFISANGGVWNKDPFAQTAVSAFTVGDGLWCKFSPTAGTYTLEAIPEVMEFDLSEVGFEPCSYTGTIPEGGKTITVNFTDSATWDQRRKLLGDFSALTNVGGLQFVKGTVWAGAPADLEMTYLNGRLGVHVNRGLLLFFK